MHEKEPGRAIGGAGSSCFAAQSRDIRRFPSTVHTTPYKSTAQQPTAAAAEPASRSACRADSGANTAGPADLARASPPNAAACADSRGADRATDGYACARPKRTGNWSAVPGQFADSADADGPQRQAGLQAGCERDRQSQRRTRTEFLFAGTRNRAGKAIGA